MKKKAVSSLSASDFIAFAGRKQSPKRAQSEGVPPVCTSRTCWKQTSEIGVPSLGCGSTPLPLHVCARRRPRSVPFPPATITISRLRCHTRSLEYHRTTNGSLLPSATDILANFQTSSAMNRVRTYTNRACPDAHRNKIPTPKHQLTRHRFHWKPLPSNLLERGKDQRSLVNLIPRKMKRIGLWTANVLNRFHPVKKKLHGRRRTATELKNSNICQSTSRVHVDNKWRSR